MNENDNFENELQELTRRYNAIKKDIDLLSSSSVSNDDGVDTKVNDLIMQINYVIEDLSSLKLKIGNENKEVQDKIYEANVELEKIMSKNAKLENEKKSTKDSQSSAEGLAEQTTYNYYVKFFFLVIKMIILGILLYLLIFSNMIFSFPAINNTIKSTGLTTNNKIQKATRTNNSKNKQINKLTVDKNKKNIIINYNNNNNNSI